MLFSIAKYIKYICLIFLVLALPSAAVIKCIQCGGSVDKCSTTIEESPKDCPNDNQTKCFTQIHNNGDIERGCRTEDEVIACIIVDNCEITEAEKNNQLICKKCDATDENCSQTDMNFNDYQYNEICHAVVTKCISKIDNKRVVRGCALESDIAKCSDTKTCQICDSVNCNTGIFPKKRINCYQCSGIDCVDVTASSLVSKPCANYMDEDQCYTLGKSETDMIRGCKSDTKENQCSNPSKGCVFCSENNCNNLKYKYDQVLKCHQCISYYAQGECFKEQNGKRFNNCEKQIHYGQPEYCYTQISGRKIQRGCLHDNTELSVDKCQDGDSETCNKCNNANGCNSKAISLSFTCIVCRSDLDAKCWNEAHTLRGKKCRSSESSPEEGCFHGLWNHIAIRGCMVDASKQDQELCKDSTNLKCLACYEKDCNTGLSSV